jgi:transcriptional regulator with XRE-family HTH domain
MRKMTLTEKNEQNGEQANCSQVEHRPTNLISRDALLRRLKRSKKARAQFVESHLDKSIAYQTRALREQEGWTQRVFAEQIGITHPNNVSARLENPNYGNQSLSTLKKIAAACDVALVVWFVPFSRMLDWVTGTPTVDNGLSDGFYSIPTFADEFEGRKRTAFDLGSIENVTPRKNVQRAEEDDEDDIASELGKEDYKGGAAERSGRDGGLAAKARD